MNIHKHTHMDRIRRTCNKGAGNNKNPVRDAAIPRNETANTRNNGKEKDGKSGIEIITPQWECDATQAKAGG